MKKKIAGVLILILIITTIIPSYVYCDDYDIKYNKQNYDLLQNEGKVQVKGKNKDMNFFQFILKAPAAMLTTILLAPVGLIPMFMSAVSGTDTVTIQDMVLNKNEFLDADYNNYNSKNEYNKRLKESVMKWFYAIRNISLAISLVMLIYMGIRMSITSLAAEKAKYKNMLLDWFIGFIITFLMHYIIIILMTISSSITNIFASLNIDSFESKLGLFETVMNKRTGLTYIVMAIMYVIIIFFQLKFFLFYTKRFLSIGFLIVISPLITVTYAIDKAKDRKSQIFDTWMREFVGNIFIQPIHAAIYMVFIVSANAIFDTAPILSVILFIMLSRAEKIMKNLFGLKKMSSMRDMEEIMKE